ncbi:MAG: hypothetical protein AAGB16_04990 [Pseudomonadota bacterium]
MTHIFATSRLFATAFLFGLAIFALSPKASAAPLCHSGAAVTENGLGTAMDDYVKRCLDAVYPRVKRPPAQVAMNFQNSARLNMKVYQGLSQFLAGSMEGVDNVATLFGFGGLSAMAEAANLFLTSDSFEQFVKRLALSKIGDKLIEHITKVEQVTKDEALKKLYESFTDQLNTTTFNFVTYDSQNELYSDAQCGKHTGRFAVRVDPKTRRTRVQSLGVCDCRARQPVMLHRGLIEGYVAIGKNKAGEVTYRFVADFMSFGGLKCPGAKGYPPKTYIWGQPYSDAPGYSFNSPDWTRPSTKTVERLRIAKSEANGWSEESETALKSLAVEETQFLHEAGLEAFPSSAFEFESAFALAELESDTEFQAEDLREDLEQE